MWTLAVVPSYGDAFPENGGQGNVYITVNANAWKDRAQNVGTVDSAEYVQFYDANPPTGVVTSAEYTTGTGGNVGVVTTTPLSVTVEWSEDVIGFAVADMRADLAARGDTFQSFTPRRIVRPCSLTST